MSFSLAIYHARRVESRRRSLRDMYASLGDTSPPTRIVDEMRPEGATWDIWQHELHPRVWRWALEQDTTHHLFMTDDLHIAPRFWAILEAMCSAKPEAILGLLSNHPAAVRLAERGARWYRTNAWVVGPAYVVPHEHLSGFLAWYEPFMAAMAPDERRHYGDDSALNYWISSYGPRESWHPLPTIIEHRGDLESTWMSGDCFSRERVSWRAHRECPLREDYRGLWTTHERRYDLEAMTRADYWDRPGPMLRVAGCTTEDAGMVRDEEIGVSR